MRHFSNKSFIWKDKVLYLGEEKLGTLVKHKEYKDMYYYKTLDGTLSDDFYNLSRAKQNFINSELFKRNIGNATLHSI